MIADNSPKQALQVSLIQLAHSFQANEMMISAEQIAECFECLHEIDRSALDRLFLLLYEKMVCVEESIGIDVQR